MAPAMKREPLTELLQVRVSAREKRSMEQMAEALRCDSLSAYIRRLHREAVEALSKERS